MRHFREAAMAAVLLTAVPAGLRAGILFRVGPSTTWLTDAIADGSESYGMPGTSPVDTGLWQNLNPPVESYAAQATQSNGALTALASAQDTTDDWGGDSAAESIYNFAVNFSGPNQASYQSHIPVSFNLAIDGSFTTTGDALAVADFMVYSTVFQDFMGGEPGNTWFQACQTSGNPWASCNTGVPNDSIVSPLLLGTTFQSGTFYVDNRNTYYFTTDLFTFAAVSTDSSALADFSHTAGFAPGQPVFNLPSGYTASSTDGLIVNNQFTGNTPEFTPEPGSGVLLIAGCGAVVALRRRLGRLRAPQG